MNAKEYNKSQWEHITYEMVQKLIQKYFGTTVSFEILVSNIQQQNNLIRDCKLGPKTRAALAPSLGEQLITEAKSHLGKGEAIANNAGPFISEMIKSLGWGWLNNPLWCSLFVSYVIYKVSKDKSGLSASVFKLHSNLINLKRAKYVNDMQPGDILIFPRKGAAFPGEGHVGLCFMAPNEQGAYKSIEGNVGKFPAKVRTFTKDIVTNPPTYILRLVK